MLSEHMVEVHTYNYYKSLGLEDPLGRTTRSYTMSDKESEETPTCCAHPQAGKHLGAGAEYKTYKLCNLLNFLQSRLEV